jgi:FKBP-type peptidyl-prolyl cis-trans isomerase
VVAARRAKTRRTTVRVVVGAVVVLALLFGWSALMGGDDDGDDTATSDETTDETPSPEETTTTSAAPAYTNPELAEEVLGREPPDPEPPPADTAADALEIETVTEGEGTGAQAGDIVVAHYVGKTSDGEVFDESWGRGEPITLPAPLGGGGVIPGWDEGLVGAKIGERRRLVIGSENAYGAQGTPDGAIPPDSPLAFEIDIVDIQPGATATPPGGSAG